MLGGAAIVNNVDKFLLMFGTASAASGPAVTGYTANPGNTDLVRSVRITLVLKDPANRVQNQSFSVLIALRNRLY
jgi:type IV pilus assembly protein PilW